METLQKLVRSLAAERASLSEAQAEIERLHLIIKKLQRSQFGRRAERLDDDWWVQRVLEQKRANIRSAERACTYSLTSQRKFVRRRWRKLTPSLTHSLHFAKIQLRE